MLQVQATQPSCGLTAPSAFKGKLRARRALKVHERWACDAPCPWAMERHLEWHVHRDNFHALWPWSGIIGITLKPETLKILALGLHISRCLEQDITSPLGKNQDISQEAHKEEIKARIGHMVLIDKAPKTSSTIVLISLIPHHIHQLSRTMWVVNCRMTQ